MKPYNVFNLATVKFVANVTNFIGTLSGVETVKNDKFYSKTNVVHNSFNCPYLNPLL